MLNNSFHINFDQFESSLKIDKGQHKKIQMLYFGKIPINRYFTDLSYIKEISFKSSKTENFLQVADMISYNVYRQFVEYGRAWKNSTEGNLPLYPYFDVIKRNLIYKKGNTRGIGLVKLPDNRNFNWTI